MLDYIGDYGAIAADTSSDEEAKKVSRLGDQSDRTRCYAGTASVAGTPGASTTTLHVDGSTISAAADGTVLDADGDGVKVAN